jgi:HPt (histidine-containing phosphotransfer) domain-containing protein
MSGNIVFLIPIVAIIGGVILSAYKAKLKSHTYNKNHIDQLENKITQLQQELNSIKERTVVLEKIITSEDYDLKSEINSL